jgi:hypothetical protein
VAAGVSTTGSATTGVAGATEVVAGAVAGRALRARLGAAAAEVVLVAVEAVLAGVALRGILYTTTSLILYINFAIKYINTLIGLPKLQLDTTKATQQRRHDSVMLMMLKYNMRLKFYHHLSCHEKLGFHKLSRIFSAHRIRMNLYLVVHAYQI